MSRLNLESLEEHPPEKGYLEEFRPLKDIRSEERVCRRIAYTLKHLIDGKIPDDEFNEKELKDLCRSCIEGQRSDLPEIEGSWSILPTEEDDPKIGDAVETIPSDAWMDLVGRPTYVVQSLLTFVLYEYPDIIEDIEGYEKNLRKGYEFSTARGYKGHGFNAVHSMINTMRVFHRSHVLEHVSENPRFAPEVYNTIKQIKSYLEKRLEAGDTSGGWSYDFKEDFEKTLEILEQYDFEKEVEGEPAEGPTVMTSAGTSDVV